MELSKAQMRQFVERGWLKLPGVIPQIMVEAARRAINSHIGQNGIHPDRLTEFRAQSYCRELTGQPVITDLYNATPIKSLVESAVGVDTLQKIDHGQIALRFPSMGEAGKPRPHLDGMYSPTNGVPEGTIQNFTALVGVFLSDLPDTDAGNFAVWEGTHRMYEKYFQEHTPQSLLNGLPAVDLPEPTQFTGKAGDAALVHYQIAHGIATNVSSNTRYAIFFRLKHIYHAEYQWECMTDIWKEWDGIHTHLAEDGQKK